jgi:hypothetical protein
MPLLFSCRKWCAPVLNFIFNNKALDLNFMFGVRKVSSAITTNLLNEAGASITAIMVAGIC